MPGLCSTSDQTHGLGHARQALLPELLLQASIKALLNKVDFRRFPSPPPLLPNTTMSPVSFTFSCLKCPLATPVLPYNLLITLFWPSFSYLGCMHTYILVTRIHMREMNSCLQFSLPHLIFEQKC